MITTILICLVGVLAVAAAGALLTKRAAARSCRADGVTASWPVPLVARWYRVRDHLVEDVGVLGAGLFVGAAGVGLTFAWGWVLGLLAHALQKPVDVPVFHWFQARLAPSTWSSLQSVLTQMGNRPEIKAVAVVAAVVLAVAWRRRWWVPVIVIAAAFVVEKYTQGALAHVVNRGHPPTTHGTYPSGGCARLISMYGTIIYLVLRRWNPALWVRGLLWTVLAEAAWLEGYARTYRLEHWFTDVVGGWIVGALLLLVFVLTASVLAGRSTTVDRAQDLPAAASEYGQGVAS